MIIKQLDENAPNIDARRRAGENAERQMAFYLNRAFAESPELYVLNGIRLIDPEQPEHNGSPGVCQIDHLVVHRRGIFLVESKSVRDEVAVLGDGSGGDEWVRLYKGREQGFPSPVQQAKRQAEFLRTFLHQHRAKLLGIVPVGLRAITKLAMGTTQRGFVNLPIQIIVAISDSGKIRRLGGWKEPTEPFQTFVCKADLVTDKINCEFRRHRTSSKLLTENDGKYGLWQMKDEETLAVAQFLADRHSAEPPVSTAAAASEYSGPKKGSGPRPDGNPAQPSCRSCGDTKLTACSGRYGYYWKCGACGGNTPMPTVCSVCGAIGARGKGVRSRKDGTAYYRSCHACGIEERIWTAAPDAP